MNRQIIILLLLVFTLSIGCKNTVSNRSLNLKELNIENTSDATPVVLEAIRKCKEEGIRKLEFPKGTYHFYPTFATDKYCAITNNDNGLKRTAFPLIGLDGLEAALHSGLNFTDFYDERLRYIAKNARWHLSELLRWFFKP